MQVIMEKGEIESNTDSKGKVGGRRKKSD